MGPISQGIWFYLALFSPSNQSCFYRSKKCLILTKKKDANIYFFQSSASLWFAFHRMMLSADGFEVYQIKPLVDFDTSWLLGVCIRQVRFAVDQLYCFSLRNFCGCCLWKLKMELVATLQQSRSLLSSLPLFKS